MSACGRLLSFVKHRNFWTQVRRNVTTWSPVGAAFNAKTHRRLNLFEKNGVSMTPNCLLNFSAAVLMLPYLWNFVCVRVCVSVSQGLFGVPELSCPAGFEVATKNTLKNTERLLEKACSCSPGIETVESFDQLSNGLCKVADLVSSTP